MQCSGPADPLFKERALPPGCTAHKACSEGAPGGQEQYMLLVAFDREQRACQKGINCRLKDVSPDDPVDVLQLLLVAA